MLHISVLLALVGKYIKTPSFTAQIICTTWKLETLITITDDAENEMIIPVPCFRDVSEIRIWR